MRDRCSPDQSLLLLWRARLVRLILFGNSKFRKDVRHLLSWDSAACGFPDHLLDVAYAYETGFGKADSSLVRRLDQYAKKVKPV